jgi:hypothetical protein
MFHDCGCGKLGLKDLRGACSKVDAALARSHFEAQWRSWDDAFQ